MKRKAWLLLACISAIACDLQRGPRLEEMTAPASRDAQSADPALAVDTGGDLLLSWVAGDSAGYHLYFARSSDAGSSWSAPVRVTDREHDIVPHAEASPILVATGKSLALFWPNHISVPGRRFPASNLRFSRSLDGGATWSPAITINDDTTAALAGHTFQGGAARGDSLVVAWLDSREGTAPHEEGSSVAHDGDATIYIAVSGDRGTSWSATNTKLWGDACPCCRVSLANSNEKLVAAWRGHFPGHVRDPVIASVWPAGEPIRVSVDGWVLEGCPHSGPAIATSDAGDNHVAWFTGKQGGAGVFYSRQSGKEFSKPIPIITKDMLPAAHPAIALVNDVPVIAINLDNAGARVLSLATVRDGSIELEEVEGTSGADHPHIIAMANGAIVAWTEKQGSGSRIRIGRVQL